MLAGIYSLLSAGVFVVMDAVDVAFTEAAVGAGISTVLILGAMSLVGHESKAPEHRSLLPLFVVFVTGAILVYGTLDIPPYGAADNPVHTHVAPEYIEGSRNEIGVPNVVTSVLASYRGYDTMGETTVVFTALVGVLLLLTAVHTRRAQQTVEAESDTKGGGGPDSGKAGDPEGDRNGGSHGHA